MHSERLEDELAALDMGLEVWYDERDAIEREITELEDNLENALEAIRWRIVERRKILDEIEQLEEHEERASND